MKVSIDSRGVLVDGVRQTGWRAFLIGTVGMVVLGLAMVLMAFVIVALLPIILVMAGGAAVLGLVVWLVKASRP